MTPRWYFNQPKLGDKNREPVLGEFFATDPITNPGAVARLSGRLPTIRRPP